MSEPAEDAALVRHSSFRQNVADARFEAFADRPGSRVASADEFEQMRTHLTALYHGVEVEHSFVDPAGQVFDCVPIAQQPSLKGQSIAPSTPPSLLTIAGAPVPTPATVRPASPAAAVDRFGNSMACPPGHIPMRRVTLEEMTRFRSLDEFRSKGPARQAVDPSVPVADARLNHRYAYTQQDVANFGAHNFVSLWSPVIGDKQIFSLAQHWYSGGTGGAHQTLEVGWQVYPQKYGHSEPVLFIFWTNDNYVASRNYNLENPGFVQTNPAWRIGGALTPVSSDGGAGRELEITVYLHDGNWWLFVGGLDVANAVGYFPASIYNGGAMATTAAQVLFGGETVCELAGTWPAMGSGHLAEEGWQHAAYQRDIFIFPTGGGAQYAAVVGQSPAAPCYTQIVGRAAPPWNTYFFFGGPGGGDC